MLWLASCRYWWHCVRDIWIVSNRHSTHEGEKMNARRASSGAYKEWYMPPPSAPPTMHGKSSAMLLRFGFSISHVHQTLSRPLYGFRFTKPNIYFAWCDVNGGTGTLHCRRLLCLFSLEFFSFFFFLSFTLCVCDGGRLGSISRHTNPASHPNRIRIEVATPFGFWVFDKR